MRGPAKGLFRRLSDEERGMAMVVALMVIFVTLLLSMAVIQQTISSLEQSGYDRKRLLSVGAAEAGIDYYYASIQNTSPATLAASGCAATQTLQSAPQAASFTATVTLYDANGAPIPCASAATTTPASALIRSTGDVSGRAPRTMETYVQLTPTYGAFGAAIISDAGLNLVNNLTLNGDGGNDADVFVNTGNFSISNSAQISGNVYVSGGSASMANNTVVKGNLSANGSVTMANSSAVNGNVTSSTSSIAVSNPAHVYGGATAGTTISGSAYIDGVESPNTPSSAPPTRPLPQIGWNPSDWTSTGYAVQTFGDCTSAKNALAGQTLTGDTVIRITAVCLLSFTGNTGVSFNGNLAIVTDGSIRSANNVGWNGIGGTRRLMLISRHRAGLSCAAGSYNVTDVNNVSYNGAEVLFYSPCTVSLANNTGFSGQVFATTVQIANNFTMRYKPVLVPGVGTVTGFEQDIVYTREVV